MSDTATSSPIPQVTPQQPQSDADRAAGAVAPSLVQSIAQTQPVVVVPQVGSSNKEKGGISSEATPIVEVNTGAGAIETEPIPEAVEAWMEKVGHDTSEIKLDTLPPVQVPPPAPVNQTSAQPVFVLPLGQEEMKMGLHASVNDSIRWLATWAKRLVKQLKGQVAYRQN